MRPLTLLLGPPEFLALIPGAMLLIATVEPVDTGRALLAGGVGVMLSFVGLEPSTATPRYTFGSLALWDGIPLVPLVIGLFALSESTDPLREGRPISQEVRKPGAFGQLLQGLNDVVHHWKVTLASAVTGLWVGVAPGLGETAAQFIAYGQARRLSSSPHRFGTGVVEGVIAADAATNSKDGGALLSTLALGVPGSASMAVLLAGFVTCGIRPGSTVLTEQVDLVWMIVWVLIIGDAVAAVAALALIRLLAALTHLPAPLIAPAMIVLALFGTFAARGQLFDVGVALAFAVVGYAMQRSGYSRASLLTGFVLGAQLERNYLLSLRLHGWELVLRPLTLGILLATAGLAVASRRPRQRSR